MQEFIKNNKSIFCSTNLFLFPINLSFSHFCSKVFLFISVFSSQLSCTRTTFRYIWWKHRSSLTEASIYKRQKGQLYLMINCMKGIIPMIIKHCTRNIKWFSFRNLRIFVLDNCAKNITQKYINYKSFKI